MNIKNWDDLILLMQNYEACIDYNKETKICNLHKNYDKCSNVAKYHKKLKNQFENIKEKYKFSKINLGQGRHTKTPWISFSGWNGYGIYPCIIFDEKTLRPYFTLQVQQRNSLSEKKDQNLPFSVIKSLVIWVKKSNDLRLSKLESRFGIKLDSKMPHNKYAKSDIFSFEIKHENFVELESEIGKLLDTKNFIYIPGIVKIIANSSNLSKIFFKSPKENANLKNFIRKQINNEFKETIIIPFTKVSYPKSEYRQLGIYIISKLPQVESSTGDFIFEAKIHSSNVDNIYQTLEFFSKNQNIKISGEASKYSEKDIKNKISQYSKTNKETKSEIQVKRTYNCYKRDRNVRATAIAMADRHCQLCKEIAPFFNKYGKVPYLESDHIKDRSKGGLDVIENVIALCPNCHRKKTHWDNIEGVREIVKKLKRRNEKLIYLWKNK